MKGKLISFEGIEGSGKSTQARILFDRLKRKGVDVVLTREPGYGSIGAKIREILLSVDSQPLASSTELLLLEADRAQHVSTLIGPELENGKIVICDRYIDSSIAYQGYGRGIEIEWIKNLNAYSTNGILPDLTFIMDMEVEISLKRSQSRLLQQDMFEKEGRFESEEIEFHQRVRDGYKKIAAFEPSRCFVINASNSLRDIADEIMTITFERVVKQLVEY